MNTTSSDASEHRSPRILVVDDSRAVRHALHEHLGKAGFEVALAENGEEGYAIASQGDFDLIITDIDMPQMDGIEMASRLKAEFATATVPIIVLAANDDTALVEEGFRVGVDAYLAKGDDMTDNVEAVMDILKSKQLLSGSRVLVVDDSQSVRAFLMAGLIGEGFVVEVASDGKEGLGKLESFKPDLIISDLMMPELDGSELLRTVKQSEDHRTVPVIMMSTVNDKPLMRRLMREGATSFLVKPFTINQLTVVIEEIFSSNYRMLLEEKERLACEQAKTLSALTAMVAAMDAREPHTDGQSERVAAVAAGIGEELGMSPPEVERLRLGGLLHDIGMIAIQDQVLLKKEPLTEEEFRHIRTHTEVAAEILRPIRSLRDILPAVTLHHERWDGSGYPDGIAGEEIPMIARIMAVADVYEALSSERPYRDSLPPGVAMEILKEDRGSKFCPDCVDGFLRWFEKTGGVIEIRQECVPE